MAMVYFWMFWQKGEGGWEGESVGSNKDGEGLVKGSTAVESR